MVLEDTEQINVINLSQTLSGMRRQTKGLTGEPIICQSHTHYLVLSFSAGGGAEEDLEGILDLRTDTGEQSGTWME